jgi:MFS transporter, SP family, general alpha glucoside:H+ symporter
METEKVVPGHRKLSIFDLNDSEALALVEHAKESNAADHKLGVCEAIKKYKKAVFWAMILSTTLVMEGYDLVIVSPVFQHKKTFLLTP